MKYTHDVLCTCNGDNMAVYVTVRGVEGRGGLTQGCKKWLTTLQYVYKTVLVVARQLLGYQFLSSAVSTSITC